LGFKLKSLNMKKFIPFLLTLFLFACKQDSTDPIIIDDSEPKVTEKYYLKFKIEDKWYLYQHSIDNFVPVNSGGLFWRYNQSYLEVFMPIVGEFGKEDMVALKGKSFYFGDNEYWVNLYENALSPVDPDNFESVGDETNKGVLIVNDVVFVRNSTDFNGEFVYKIKGTMENVKMKFKDGSIKYLTNGTFEFQVGTYE
jgi:hypothetical protein